MGDEAVEFFTQPGELYPLLAAWAPILRYAPLILPYESLWQPLGMLLKENLTNKYPDERLTNPRNEVH